MLLKSTEISSLTCSVLAEQNVFLKNTESYGRRGPGLAMARFESSRLADSTEFRTYPREETLFPHNQGPSRPLSCE